MKSKVTMCFRDSSNELIVSSPDHPKLERYAKRMGSGWNKANKTWNFLARDEDNVRQMYQKLFGDDAITTDDRVARLENRVAFLTERLDRLVSKLQGLGSTLDSFNEE